MRNYFLLFVLFLINLAPATSQPCDNYDCVVAQIKKALREKDYSKALKNLKSADAYEDSNAAEIQELSQQTYAAMEKKEEETKKISRELAKANAENIQFLSEKIQFLFKAADSDISAGNFKAALDKISTAEGLGAPRDNVQAAYQNLTRSALNSARQNIGQGEYRLALDDINSADTSAVKTGNPVLSDSVSLTYQMLWRTVFDKTRGDILNSNYDAAAKNLHSVYGLNDSLETTLSLFYEIAYCYAVIGRHDDAGAMFDKIAQTKNDKNVIAVLQAREGRSPALQIQILRKASLLLDPELHAQVTAKYFPKDLVKIPAGTFNMGHAAGNETTCPVKVDAFLLSPKEVTFYEYDLYCNAAGRQKPPDNGWGRGRRPVVDITWHDAVAYCNWRSRQEGLAEVYRGDSCNRSANGYRLPTEAEWEYAAGNGARHTQYSWGNELPGAAKGGNVPDKTVKDSFPAWEVFNGYSDGFAYTAPTGHFAPNDFGLYDMSGNVWEWCFDGFTSDYCQTNKSGKTSNIPPAPAERVLRGGSWGGYPDDCRVSTRFHGSPGKHNFSIGFRLARNMSGF